METLKYIFEKMVNEKYILLLICFIIGFAPINSVILLTIRSFVILPLKIDVVITHMFYAIVLLMALITIITRVKKDSYFLISFFVFFYLMSILFFDFAFDNWFKFGIVIFASVSCYAISRSITDYDQLKMYLSYTAIQIGVSSFLLFFVFRIYEDESYSQSVGYMALPAIIISASLLFDKFKILHLLNCILSLAVIFFSGARGPFVCLILFLGFKLLFLIQMNKKKFISIFVGLSLIILLISNNYQTILDHLYNTSLTYGYSTRLSSTIAKAAIFEDYDRIQLIEYSKQLIIDNPLFGVGIYRDRLLLTNLINAAPEDAAGFYPHNIFLEIPLHFGLVVGSLMILCLLITLLYHFLKNRNKDEKDIILIFAAIGMFPLFFSGSYLESGLFFLLLGFCANFRFKKYNDS